LTPVSDAFDNGQYFLLVTGQTGGVANTYSGTSNFIAAVPEPSTWAMMLLGFAGLGFAFRQSRRKVSFA
jgi:hypothetical protein